MPAFEYRALDGQGHKRKGFIEADSERQARQQLRDRGLLPLSVQGTQGQRDGRGVGINLGRGLPAREIALFTRQLATLIESGLPLEEALHAIARQSSHRRLKGTILGIRSRIMEGHSLADALSEYPRCFDALYQAMVSAGEGSGSLGPVLMRLADHGERLQQIRAKVQLALLYPSALTVVAIGVITLLMTYVVPKVVAQFDHMGQSLPWLTRLMITLSEGLQNYGLFLLAGLFLTGLLIRWWLRAASRRIHWHRLQLRLPLIRGFVLGQQSLQFARTLSILVGSGQDLMESLRIAAGPLTNLQLRLAVDRAAKRVREGSPLASALEESGHFPPMLVYMIANGEQSGELEQMLIRAAQNQESEFETRVGWLLGLFEPILILLMGGIVLAIVLAILLPIMQLNNLTALSG